MNQEQAQKFLKDNPQVMDIINNLENRTVKFKQALIKVKDMLEEDYDHEDITSFINDNL